MEEFHWRSFTQRLDLGLIRDRDRRHARVAQSLDALLVKVRPRTCAVAVGCTVVVCYVDGCGRVMSCATHTHTLSLTDVACPAPQDHSAAEQRVVADQAATQLVARHSVDGPSLRPWCGASPPATIAEVDSCRYRDRHERASLRRGWDSLDSWLSVTRDSDATLPARAHTHAPAGSGGAGTPPKPAPETGHRPPAESEDWDQFMLRTFGAERLAKPRAYSQPRGVTATFSAPEVCRTSPAHSHDWSFGVWILRERH